MDLYSTEALVAVVQDLREPSMHLRGTYFPGSSEHEEETLNIDVEVRKQRITPLVHPTRAGKIVDNESYETKSFKPAYAKDLRNFDPASATKRSMGEKIGGELTNEQRVQANLSRTLEDQTRMLARREEVMAAEIMRTGKVTVSGEGYKTVVVDFGRDAGLTVTLTSNDRWSINHADSDPLEDLELWSGLIGDASGGTGRIITSAPDTFRAFRRRLRDRSELEMLFNLDRGGNSDMDLAPSASNPQGLMFKGRIGGFEWWTCSGSYVDDAGNTQRYCPSGTLYMGDEAIEGRCAYGFIKDFDAKLKAMRFFVKSKIEWNPSAIQLLLQSAPLVVPFRPNATFCATVF